MNISVFALGGRNAMRTEQEEQESSVGPQQVVGYKLTFAENGGAPELAGSIWTRMAKCDDPIHSRREGRQSGPGADVKKADGKFREQMDQD